MDLLLKFWEGWTFLQTLFSNFVDHLFSFSVIGFINCHCRSNNHSHYRIGRWQKPRCRVSPLPLSPPFPLSQANTDNIVASISWKDVVGLLSTSALTKQLWRRSRTACGNCCRKNPYSGGKLPNRVRIKKRLLAQPVSGNRWYFHICAELFSESIWWLFKKIRFEPEGVKEKG